MSNDPMYDDPGYHVFVEGQRKQCYCTGSQSPCDGVLAGGMCDDIRDDDDDDEEPYCGCMVCGNYFCDGECIQRLED